MSANESEAETLSPPILPPATAFWSEKMVKWVIFSVLMALVPLITAALIQLTRSITPSMDDLIGRGELLLITAALCARSCGELFSSDGGRKTAKVVAGGSTMVILLLTAIYFADVASAVRTKTTIDSGLVAGISIVTYISALVSGGSCIRLSEAQP